MATLTAASASGDVRPAQPRALIVTLYGLYARETAGWISVAALIKMMAELGADEPAVRSSISRLKQRGILEQHRDAGTAGYALSPLGREVLAEGDRRIFGRHRARLSDGWLLAVFSVPEPERRRRHALRTRLAWLGFGTVSSGVWIAPGHLADETRDVLQRHGLAGYVTLFRADYLAFSDLRGQVARWWDLDRLDRMYQEFLDSAGPVLRRWRQDGPGRRTAAVGAGTARRGDAAAFADYVIALTAWRRLPYLDPGLPAEVLPAEWTGLRAAETFAALRRRLAGPAHAHARQLTRW